MDFKSLISKLDTINKKQILNEGKDWDKDGKVEKPAQEYKGVKDAAIKKAMAKKSTKKEGIEFKSGIAQYLLREFGLDEAVNPDAIQQIQTMLKQGGRGVERLQNAIDPFTGIIYYGDDQGDSGVSPKMMPYDFITKGQEKEFQQLLKAAGLSIIPKDQKTVFGSTKVAAVDPKTLATLTAPVTAGVQGSTAATADQPDGPDGSNASAPAAPAAQSQQDAAYAQAAANQDAAGSAPAAVASPVADVPEPTMLDPKMISRFEELLGKVKTSKAGTPTNKPQSTAATAAPTQGTASWQTIYNANKQVIGNNPNLIKPGQKLTMPDGSTYVVKSGDNLSKIAKNFKPNASAQPQKNPNVNPIKNTDSNTQGPGGLDTSTSLVAP